MAASTPIVALSPSHAAIWVERPFKTLAVFEFAEKAQIEAFFASDEYKALTALREKGADMVLSAHEGAQ